MFLLCEFCVLSDCSGAVINFLDIEELICNGLMWSMVITDKEEGRHREDTLGSDLKQCLLYSEVIEHYKF